MAPFQEPALPDPPTKSDNIHYTVLIRLPFPRGEFVDPAPVDWDSIKDRELWNILSKASSKGRDLDWQGTADRFKVSLPFLTQQAAWLYERQLSQVRAQLRKVNKPSLVGTCPSPSSISGSATAGGHAMTRGGSGGSRVPSSLSQRPKERTSSRGDGSVEVSRLARGNPMSRTASSNTVTQIRNNSLSSSQRSPAEQQSYFANRGREASLRSIEVPPKENRRSLERQAGPSAIASSSSSSSSSDSDAPHPMSRSRAFTSRRPRYSSNKAPLNPLSDADEEDEDSTPFLPFSDARTTTPPPPVSPSATLKFSSNRPQSRRHPDVVTKLKHPLASQNPHSSSSSAQSQPQSQKGPPHNPLSTLSPKQRRIAKEGSDGTPSMGSSFSDLDDASVTQSALEEALANEMTHGGVASRMSTISQALRSRYL